jgi:hypothetical protein
LDLASISDRIDRPALVAAPRVEIDHMVVLVGLFTMTTGMPHGPLNSFQLLKIRCDGTVQVKPLIRLAGNVDAEPIEEDATKLPLQCPVKIAL